MANDISARPWRVDTASATALWKGQVFVKFIEVTCPTAAGSLGTQMALVTDQNAKTIINSLAQTTNAGEIQTYNCENWFNGLIVSTLASGVILYIHVK